MGFLSNIKLAKDQTAHTSAAELQKKDPKEMRKKLEKNKEAFTKMILAMVKNQDPTAENNSGDIAKNIVQVSALIGQTDAINYNSDRLDELVENLKTSAVTKNASLIGKTASYDDGTKEFMGGPVEFNYQIKRPIRVSDSTKLNVKIEIVSDEGKVVFKGHGSDRQGENNFIWDGRNNAGKIQPNGSYTLKVSASDSTNKNTVIEATTFLSGKIEGVEAGHYIINGKKVKDSIVKRIEDSTQKSNSATANDYINAIGKQAEVDLSSIEIKNGKAQLTFNNNVEKPGKLRVVVLDQNSRMVKSINLANPVQQGINSINISTGTGEDKINDGDYKCKVYVTDEVTEKEVLLVSTMNVEVTGIDLVNKQFITAGGQKFDTSNLLNIGSNSSTNNSLITQSGYYIGKQVRFEENSFTYNGLNIPSRFIAEEPEEANRKLAEVRLNIFKGQDIVASIIKNGDDLIEAAPKYDELDANSKIVIDNLIKKYGNGDPSYAGLDLSQKFVIDMSIVTKFKEGLLFKNGQDTTSQAIRNKNSGNAVFEWDGKLANGSYANIGEVYRKEFAVKTTSNDGNNAETKIEKNQRLGTVKQTKVENGEIKLVMNDGEVVNLTNAQLISN